MLSTGSRKSLISSTPEKRLRRRPGGRLSMQHQAGPSIMAIASASLVVALRLADGRVRPRIATRSPPRTSSSAAASISTMARSRFVTLDRWLRKSIEGDRSGQSQTVCAASHSRSRT